MIFPKHTSQVTDIYIKPLLKGSCVGNFHTGESPMGKIPPMGDSAREVSPRAGTGISTVGDRLPGHSAMGESPMGRPSGRFY